ncbi:unnamed protein product [Phytophthora fragariaefolia]|uniref:Unnamed protein product n=1 Tax=Phytophthora fragariaefolia TaxID=1490495 RepID=A0A9W7D1P2_9STRA|nr:unnamed protein product [Phytophthora fragariaefolia]
MITGAVGNAPVFGIAEENVAEKVGHVAVTLAAAVITGVTDATEPAPGTMAISLVGIAPLPADRRKVSPPPSIPLVLAKLAGVTFGVPAFPLNPVQVAITLEVTILTPADAAVDVAVALLVVVVVELLAVLDAALNPDIPKSSTNSVRQSPESWAHNLPRCAGECRLEEQRSWKDNAKNTRFPLINFGIDEEKTKVSTPFCYRVTIL